LHLGVLSLASALRARGISARLLDYNFSPDPQRELVDYLETASDCTVGITCHTCSVSTAAAISQQIRSRRDCPVIFGGPHASFSFQELLTTGVCDYVVVGEGEITLLELTRQLATQGAVTEPIKGCAYRLPDGTIEYSDRDNLCPPSRLPQLDYGLVDMAVYSNRASHSGVPAVFSRGCCFGCLFCVTKSLWRRTTRYYPLARKAAELNHLITGSGVRDLCFRDDNLFLDEVYLDQLLTSLAKPIVFSGETSADFVSRDRILHWHRRGLRYLRIGLESIRTRDRTAICKPAILPRPWTEVIEELKRLKDLPLQFHLNLILGIPGQTEESLLHDLDVYKKLRSDNVRFCCSILTPLPGTEYYHHPERHGICIESGDFSQYLPDTSVISTASLSRERIEQLHRLYVRELDTVTAVRSQGFGSPHCCEE